MARVRPVAPVPAPTARACSRSGRATRRTIDLRLKPAVKVRGIVRSREYGRASGEGENQRRLRDLAAERHGHDRAGRQVRGVRRARECQTPRDRHPRGIRPARGPLGRADRGPRRPGRSTCRRSSWSRRSADPRQAGGRPRPPPGGRPDHRRCRAIAATDSPGPTPKASSSWRGFRPESNSSMRPGPMRRSPSPTEVVGTPRCSCGPD